ncbi:hypothetical protein L0Y65_01470 [Candidatus Micrarchaeota archaeon]|nr:hypothetical protein [Candidatus Micrarchaeota archaeon]
MLIDKSIASKLRALKPGDAIEINGEMFEVENSREWRDTRVLSGIRETRCEGMEFDLLGKESSRRTLTLEDGEAEYERVAEFDGPAPLNPFPDILFVQDGGRTYKYRIIRRGKGMVSVRFHNGDAEIELKSVALPNSI